MKNSEPGGSIYRSNSGTISTGLLPARLTAQNVAYDRTNNGS
jgi:hypothetical protein